MSCFALNSFSVGTASTLIGSTAVSALAKRSKSSLNAHSSAVHVLVKASGKNASSTFCRPPKLASFTSLPDVDESVKWGAGAPIASVLGVITGDPPCGQQCHHPRNPGQPSRVPAVDGPDEPVHYSATTDLTTRQRSDSVMHHALPPLPYDFAALEPHIDTQTMQIHHGKHHQAYVNNLNAALAKHPDLDKWPLEDLLKKINQVPEDIRTAVRNNAGGHHNHSLFWTWMGPKAGGEPSGAVGDAIKKTFGDFTKFKEQIAAAGTGRFGSGWAWLVWSGGKLEILSTANQDSPLMDGKTPVLGVDVWEHPESLKDQNPRPPLHGARGEGGGLGGGHSGAKRLTATAARVACTHGTARRISPRGRPLPARSRASASPRARARAGSAARRYSTTPRRRW